MYSRFLVEVTNIISLQHSLSLLISHYDEEKKFCFPNIFITVKFSFLRFISSHHKIKIGKQVKCIIYFHSSKCECNPLQKIQNNELIYSSFQSFLETCSYSIKRIFSFNKNIHAVGIGYPDDGVTLVYIM